jgi:phage terminase large subunit-like protein
VKIVRGDWNEAYLDELCNFPRGEFSDQVDASSRSFSRLIKAPVVEGIASPEVITVG